MYKRLVASRMITITICATIYVVLDFFVQITGFLIFGSYVGIKSFLPITFGLLFGIYGVMGGTLACIVTSAILRTPINYFLTEIFCIVIQGIGAWFLWHIKTLSYKVHFRYVFDYIKYFIIVMILVTISAFIGQQLVGGNAFKEIMIWYISLSILVGIPVDIIYSGLMCLNPILPPLKDKNGKKITIKDDIVYNLSTSRNTVGELNEKIEELAMEKNIEMKRLFEIQNCIEEIYLRIVNNYNDIYIDTRVNYDIVFSVEFNYIGKLYNPFFIKVYEDASDIAGLKLIKHRALLVSYSYLFGENNIHVVI